MNLLFYDSDEKINLIAKKVFDRQFVMDPLLNNEYDMRRKKHHDPASIRTDMQPGMLF